ncbi:MAG TPA: hypothetical protein VNI58_07705 [Mariprofundaceae bacterium]|nr:hypothetical protein [Mariprofundaceae bacterium]
MIKVYGVLYVLLSLIGLADTFLAGQFGIGNIIPAFFTILYSIGLWGYILRKAVFSPEVWRIAFYFACFGTVGLVLMSAMGNTSGVIIGYAIAALFMIPLIVVLKRYSNANLICWFSQDALNKGEILAGLFDNRLVISLRKEDENNSQREHVVSIEKKIGSYAVKLQKNHDGSQEEYTEVFPHLAAVAQYIERGSMITVEDLAISFSR